MLHKTSQQILAAPRHLPEVFAYYVTEIDVNLDSKPEAMEMLQNVSIETLKNLYEKTKQERDEARQIAKYYKEKYEQLKKY